MIFWLLAFMVQSSLWLGAAWLLTRSVPRIHARTRETVWYTAIVTSLVVPSVQAIAPESLAALWTLPLPSHLFVASEPGQAAASGDVLPGSGAASGWLGLTVWVWVAISVALLVLYVGRYVWLRRALAAREPAAACGDAVAFESLARRAGFTDPPRLSMSDHLGSPIAIGLGTHKEICVPTRAFHELDCDQLRAMLAHEVAHHMRRDPARLAVLNVLRAVLWFQPLMHAAVRAVRETAEEQCDAWAAHHPVDRLAMASCLAEVAGWMLPRDRRLPVVGMARSSSQLRIRVDRLMEGRERFDMPGRFWRGLGAASVLVLAPWIAPAVTPARALPIEVSTPARPAVANTVPTIIDFGLDELPATEEPDHETVGDTGGDEHEVGESVLEERAGATDEHGGREHGNERHEEGS